jgi:hypothetical protein
MDCSKLVFIKSFSDSIPSNEKMGFKETVTVPFTVFFDLLETLRYYALQDQEIVPHEIAFRTNFRVALSSIVAIFLSMFL